MYGLSISGKIWPQMTSEGQKSRSNPKRFEVKYLNKSEVGISQKRYEIESVNIS